MNEPARLDPSPELKSAPRSFSELSGEKRRGPWRELAAFALENKRWWLIPILVILIAVGALALLSGTGLAPFIYTVF
jgi:hypothetical protein